VEPRVGGLHEDTAGGADRERVGADEARGAERGQRRGPCTANASGASGATTIASLVVAGQTLTNITPAANTSITVPGVGQLVLNEQSRPTATSITVNAVHLSLIAGTDIIVAHASCDIDP
jgi:hypothetical protein